MRALVTGSSGFAGRHLVEHCEAAGDAVSGLDRSDGVDILDPGAVATALEAVRPEIVYHLAGWADVGASWKNPRATFEANAVGTLHLLDAARAAGTRRVIVVGSADVYGTVTEDELPLTEDQPVRPTSPYAASKLAAEALAQQAWLGYGLETIIVRAFNHLGPRQSPQFVAPGLADRVVRNEREQLDELEVGNLTPRRDFTDVRDVVRAYRMLALGGTPGEVYHVCSGRDVSIGELAERLIALAQRPMTLVSDPDLQRPVDLPVLRGDASKLSAATGWEPRFELDGTLADLLAEARERVSPAR
ncbi:MAG: GDP-mannose 4,6-dehydratase [Acidimicrobiales bacterium]|nr:GDP-mannose 4,6-dehydratase [Acidimicrobiales bacterium]